MAPSDKRHEGVDESAGRVGRGEDDERDEGRGDAAEAETLKAVNRIGAIEELFDDSGADDDEEDEPDRKRDRRCERPRCGRSRRIWR
jgi:hypothetical protein